MDNQGAQVMNAHTPRKGLTQAEARKVVNAGLWESDMSAHTPGPWEVVKDGIGHAILGRVGGERIIVAEQLDEADARLIAAAPRMLSVIRELLAPMDQRTLADAENEARAILRDVEG